MMVKLDLKLSAFRILEYLCSLDPGALKSLTISSIMRATGLSRRTVLLQLKWLRLATYIALEHFSRWEFQIEVTSEGQAALKEHHNFDQVPQL